MLLNTSTTRTYKLRNRNRAGRASQSARALNKSPSLLDVDDRSNEAGPLQEDTAPTAEVPVTVRTYSDVVASRPPSPPRRERPVLPSDLDHLAGPAMGPDRMRLPSPRAEGSYDSQDDEMEDNRSGEVETLDKPEYHR